MILFTSSRIPSCTNHEKEQSPTLSCASCVTVDHADWFFPVIIVTGTYEDLFCFVTNALRWLDWFFWGDASQV